MHRGKFIKLLGITGVAAICTPSPTFGHSQTRQLGRPERLKIGDKVGVITPGSALSESGFEEALENIKSLGLIPIPATHANKKYGFLGGTDFQRLSDLHEMFERDDIKGIICARGGYGTGRLLEHLDFDLIRRNPKVFVGFSDITALLNAIYKETKLICFHGPVGASDFTGFTRSNFEQTLFSGKALHLEADNGYTITKGSGKGRLVGGNLTLINSLIGTPYEINLRNKILLIEEVGESPYRIDRMLTQLLNSGQLQRANGIVFGRFVGCDIASDDPDYKSKFTLKQVLKERGLQANIPCYYGFDFGHIDDNATLPIGMKVFFDADKGILKSQKSAIR